MGVSSSSDQVSKKDLKKVEKRLQAFIVEKLDLIETSMLKSVKKIRKESKSDLVKG